MYDWFPESWAKMIKNNIAAQQYPTNWENEKKNITILKRIKKGDFVVAAFKKHRFAGYGEIKSDFYKGGLSLNILKYETNEMLPFHERFDCNWNYITNRKQPYLDLSFLKKRNISIDLVVGACAKEIDQKSFEAIKAELDKSNLIKSILSPVSNLNTQLDYENTQEIESTFIQEEEIKSEGEEGRIKQIKNHFVRERNYKIVQDKRKSILNLTRKLECEICGFDFFRNYGELGKNYCEIHHIKPLAESEDKVITKLEDLAVLCSNCHRIIHRTNPFKTVSEFKEYYKNQNI
jgi:5-methylcytosine-specific restriction endonuclease McrA